MPVGPNGVWVPDTNPMLGIAQTVGTIQRNQLIPLEAQQMKLGIQTGQQALAQAQTDNLGQMFASTQDPTEIPGAMARAVQAGLIDPGRAAALTAGGPAAWSMLRNQAVARYGTAPEVGEVFPQPVTRETGAQTETFGQTVSPQGVNLTPATGAGATVQKVQPPEVMGGMLSAKRSDGSVVNFPRSLVENPDGTGKPNVMGPDGQQLTGPHGEILAALPAGQEGALASNVQNQQDRANTLQTAFEGSAQRKALLEELRQVQGDFRTGPGAAKWAGIVTEFNRIFNTNFATDQASAEQVFGKISQMVAAQQRDTLGLPATNAGEAAAELAAPNTTYSPQANLALIAQLEGNEDLLQKKQAAWTKYSTGDDGKPRPGATYNGFVTQFNRTYDPRFFWDQYAPDQQKAETSMTPAQRKEYERRRDAAMGLKF